MNILEQSRELTKVELYLMTKNPACISVSNVADSTVINVSAFLVYEDINSKGETVELLSILTPDNKVYACQSATFKKSFKDIADIADGDEFAVVKVSGTTKAGRPYINCVLDVNSL